MAALGWIMNLGFAAGPGEAEEPAAEGGGGRPMPPRSRLLPPRETLTLRKKRKEEEEPESLQEPAAPPPSPVINLEKVREAIGKLAEDETPIATIADILEFVPRPDTPRDPDQPLSRQDIEDAVLRIVVPLFRQIQNQLEGLDDKVGTEQSALDALRVQNTLEQERAKKAELLLLLLQLLAVIHE